MLSALNDSQDSFDELAKCIDPNLTSYDKDSLYEVWLISTFSCAFEVLRSVWLLYRNKKKKVETEWKCLGNSLFEQIYFKSVFISSIKIVFVLLYLFLLSWDTKQTQHICNVGRNYFNYLNLLSLHCPLIGLRSCSKLSFLSKCFSSLIRTLLWLDIFSCFDIL